jgi:hypothetical protein
MKNKEKKAADKKAMIIIYHKRAKRSILEIKHKLTKE